MAVNSVHNDTSLHRSNQPPIDRQTLARPRGGTHTITPTAALHCSYRALNRCNSPRVNCCSDCSSLAVCVTHHSSNRNGVATRRDRSEPQSHRQPERHSAGARDQSLHSNSDERIIALALSLQQQLAQFESIQCIHSTDGLCTPFPERQSESLQHRLFTMVRQNDTIIEFFIH